MSINDVKFC